MDEINAKWVSSFFKKKGLKNTSKWITIALKTRMSDMRQDFNDIIDSMRVDVRNYKREYYDYPRLKEASFDSVLKSIIGGMTVGSSEFNKLTAKLVPILQEMIETNEFLEDIAGVAEKLEDKPRFYMLCFYYLILWEGSYKNACRQLLAMKRLKEGKKVEITETLEVVSEEKAENKKNLKDVLPDCLREDIHENLRNAIAHSHFRYVREKNEMEFWDICPKGGYSLRPKRFSYREFSKYLLDVNIFCEIFGFAVLLLIALTDIAKRR